MIGALGGGIGFVVVLLLGLVQIWIGVLGIEFHLGVWWAVGAIAAALLARFMLPLTIGAFFGATDVLGMHWVVGLLIAAPGLIFVVPGVIATIVAGVRGRAR
jgi:hypothetical protein